jgi:hypothetical protein
MAAMGFCAIATADFVDWHFERYPVSVGGADYSVIDVYAQFDGTTDTALNVFNSMISNANGTSFHHGDLGTQGGEPGSWSVQQTVDLPSAGLSPASDSFVLVGGPYGSSNNTALDPSFTPPNAAVPPVNAGWYTSNPTALQGRVDPATRRTFVARFVIEGLSNSETLRWAANLGYNQGLGTPAQFGFDDGQGSGPFFEVPFVSLCVSPPLDPASASIAATGGTLSLGVVATESCLWSASSSVDWVTFPSGNSGSGPGSLTYEVAAQGSADPRVGEIVINGSVHTLTQLGAACTVVSLGDPEQSFPVGGGTHSFDVATNGSACSWSAFSSAVWVTITSGATGTGSIGTIAYSVAANPSAVERTAVIVVGGQSHFITQEQAACAVTGLGDSEESFSSTGGDHVFTVSTNGAICTWSATSSAGWVTVLAGGSGTGSSGAVVYQVDANPIAVPRTATITVGGLVHTVNQEAAACAVLAIAPTSSSFESAGGSGSFSLSTNGSVCDWAASTTVPWIEITSGSGTGLTGTVTYSVAANPNAEPREGGITIDGLTHSVSQEAAPCEVVSVDPSSLTTAAAGGSYLVNVTTNGSACGWTAATGDSWILLSGSGGTGTGELAFSVEANPTTFDRVGTITVDGLAITVSQLGQPCIVTGFEPVESTFSFEGGSGTTTLSTNGGNCTWDATSDAAWLTITSGGSGAGESGTVEFAVEIYPGVETRVGTITAGDEVHLVTQEGGLDCNGDGIGDAYEIQEGLTPDCNGNGIPDSCDIASGESPDANGNGIPDECEVGFVAAVPGDFPTIQAAVDGSVTGWIIRVSPGTYFERVVLGNRQITLESVGGPAVTTINGQGQPGTVVTMIAPQGNTEPGPTLRGFTIRGGTIGTQVGSGTTFGGGGVYAAYSRATIENCWLQNNTAPNGSGAYLYLSEVMLSQSRVNSNQSTGFGGGLQIFRGACTVEGGEVRLNTTLGQAGGIHIVEGDSAIIDVEISSNGAAIGGGLSIFPNASSSTIVSGCTIQMNVATTAAGGLWVRPGFDNVLLEDTTICNNFPDEISGQFTDLGGNTLCLCPGDITGNGEVNGADLAELLAAWGPCVSGICQDADLNGDGLINGADLSILLSAWGPCP